VTNYFVRWLGVALFAGACQAAAPTQYTQAPGSGSLGFSFEQAGARSQGSFKKFTTALAWDAANPATGTLQVTVQIDSLDTQDKDRDEALRGPDLFDAKKYATAKYVANSLAKRADGGLEAVGKLTLRGVTRDLRLPLTLKTTASGVELSGEVTLKRLEFGVGQGEWKSTEWVGDDVTLHYQVPLTRKP
jgi:polyisoprenoid-binding protein YceI